MLAVILGGCGTVKKEVSVEKTGEIRAKSGEEYIMSTDEGLVNVTSNKESLDQYQGKTIKVQGQYSGSTLYIDEIKLIEE